MVAEKKRSGILRLYNIYYISKLYLPVLQSVKVVDYSVDSEEGKRIVGWEEAKKAVFALGKFECFHELAESVFNALGFLKMDADYPVISSAKSYDFNFCLRNLITAVATVVQLGESLELKESKSGIDIKIPKCESLKEYMGYLKEIDFIFTQCPYLLHEKEEIKFNTVDVGSQWLVFAVVGVTSAFYILNNLAQLVQKAVVIRSNLNLCKQQEEILREMQQKGEVRDETVQVFKTLKQTLMDNCVSELEEEIGVLQDGEERDKVRKTVEMLALLMDKGVELYSSIETPKEIKVLFPFEKDTAILPDNVLKLIEDKNASDKGEEK